MFLASKSASVECPATAGKPKPVFESLAGARASFGFGPEGADGTLEGDFAAGGFGTFLNEIPAGMPSKVQGKDGKILTSLMWLKFPYRDQGFWYFLSKKYKKNKFSVTSLPHHRASLFLMQQYRCPFSSMIPEGILVGERAKNISLAKRTGAANLIFVSSKKILLTFTTQSKGDNNVR